MGCNKVCDETAFFLTFTIIKQIKEIRTDFYCITY